MDSLFFFQDQGLYTERTYVQTLYVCERELWMQRAIYNSGLLFSELCMLVIGTQG